jgi:Uma2 family endonuclease
MPATTIPDGTVTFDQFCALLPDYQKADLINGVVYLALADTRRANLTAGLLMSLMQMYDSAKKLDGAVFGGRFAFQLARYDGLEPDVAYVTKRRLPFLDEFRMNGGPDIAVEIISPESEFRDRVLKRDKYEEAGVSEYWLIDADQRKVQFLRLGVDGRYHAVRLEKGRIFRSRMIPGFWLDVEWLTDDHAPDAYECLQALLGS